MMTASAAGRAAGGMESYGQSSAGCGTIVQSSIGQEQEQGNPLFQNMPYQHDDASMVEGAQVDGMIGMSVLGVSLAESSNEHFKRSCGTSILWQMKRKRSRS